MKKTLLLFAMLLGVVGAWAQEDTFVYPETGKYYKLKGDNEAGKPWLTNQLTSNSIVVSANSAEAAIFLKTANGLQDVATGKYLGMNGKVVSLVTNETTITIGEYNNETGNGVKYSVKVSNNYMYNNNTDGKTHESSDWINNIERFWGFVEVNSCLEELTIDNFNADRTTWTLYNGNAHTGGWGYKVVTNTTTPQITLQCGANANDLGWSTKNTIRYPYLVRNKTYLITIPEEYKIIEYYIQTASELNYVGEVSYELSNNQIKIMLENGTGDDGTAGVTIRKIVLRYVKRQSCDITLSDNVGNQYQGTVEAFPGIDTPPTFTGVEYTLTNKSWNGNQFTADIEFNNLPFPVSSAEVANIVLMSIGGDQRKWSARKGLNDEYYIHILNETPELGTWQWVIYPQFEGGVFKFKIMNVATGKYVYAKPENTGVQPQPQGWVDNNHDSYPVILNDEGTAFAIEMSGDKPRFTYQSNSNKLYLTVNGSGSNDCPLGVWTGTHSFEDVTFPTFNQYKITIGSTGYTTLYSPFPVIFNDHQYNTNTAEYYAITSETTGNTVSLTDMSKYSNWYGSGDYIPANQGAILKGNPGTYTFTKIDPIEEFDEAWSNNNKLKGSVTNTYVADDAYVLSAPGGVVGLYKADLNFYNVDGVWTKDAENGTHFKNNAGKAYILASDLSAEAPESRFFVFSFGDDMETGITETENGLVKTENTVVYDLAGRRVQGAQKGIFIVNGKKVVR